MPQDTVDCQLPPTSRTPCGKEGRSDKHIGDDPPLPQGKAPEGRIANYDDEDDKVDIVLAYYAYSSDMLL